MYTNKENFNINNDGFSYFVIGRKEEKLFNSNTDGMYSVIVKLTVVSVNVNSGIILSAKCYSGCVQWELVRDNMFEAVRRVAEWGDMVWNWTEKYVNSLAGILPIEVVWALSTKAK